jgi:rod shape-determining protein MreC
MASRTKGAVVVLGATGLTLILLDLVGGAVPETIRNVGASALSPLQTVSGAIAAPAVGWIEATGSFASGELRATSWQEQAPAVTQIRGEQRVTELDAMLGMLNMADLTVVPSRVVAYPIISLDVTNVLIDTGTADQVTADQAVISGQGLVGRTVEVTPGTADVKLLSAPDSAVGGRILRTGQAVVVVGTGDPNSLLLRVLDPLADVQLGDAVITFGSKDGKPFPPDLPIGVVTVIDDDGAGGRLIRLEPAADLTGLDLVGVIVGQGDRAVRAPLVGVPPEPEPEPEPVPVPEPAPEFYQDPGTYYYVPEQPAVGATVPDQGYYTGAGTDPYGGGQ